MVLKVFMSSFTKCDFKKLHDVRCQSSIGLWVQREVLLPTAGEGSAPTVDTRAMVSSEGEERPGSTFAADIQPRGTQREEERPQPSPFHPRHACPRAQGNRGNSQKTGLTEDRAQP